MHEISEPSDVKTHVNQSVALPTRLSLPSVADLLSVPENGSLGDAL